MIYPTSSCHLHVENWYVYLFNKIDKKSLISLNIAYFILLFLYFCLRVLGSIEYGEEAKFRIANIKQQR